MDGSLGDVLYAGQTDIKYFCVLARGTCAAHSPSECADPAPSGIMVNVAFL